MGAQFIYLFPLFIWEFTYLKANSKSSKHRGNINTTWVSVSPTSVAIEQITGYRKHCWTTSSNPQTNGRMPLPSIIFFKILILADIVSLIHNELDSSA